MGPLFLFFRRFCKSLYEEERIYVGENPIASYEAGYGVGNGLTGTTLKSFFSLSSADFTNRIMERKLAQLVERRVEFPYVIGSSPIQPL